MAEHPAQATARSVRVLTVHFDEAAQVSDPERGECEDAVVAGAADPDHAIFGLHVDGEIEEPIDGFARFGCNAVDGLDGMHIVERHDHAAFARGRDFRFQGRISWMRETGMSGSRARTSASRAGGSMSFILAVTMRVYMAAARSPPRPEPANSHGFRPGATPRRARSAALFVRQMRPSSGRAVKACQRPSLWKKSLIALATSLSPDSFARSAGSQPWRLSTRGRDRSWRAARRATESSPLISRSISKMASIRFTAPCAICDI